MHGVTIKKNDCQILGRLLTRILCRVMSRMNEKNLEKYRYRGLSERDFNPERLYYIIRNGFLSSATFVDK